MEVVVEVVGLVGAHLCPTDEEQDGDNRSRAMN